MSVRSRLAERPVAKAFGGDINAPPAMAQAAELVSQMGPTHPFSPGIPVGPYDGYSRTPRTFNFETSYNVATRPRTHERVSFDTLRGLIESYDVAEICIWHRIDTIRGLDWQLVAADGFTGDITDAAALGKEVLKKPDGLNSFSSWLAKFLYDVLAYDAGALYRLRNRAGRCIGLQPVDGSTIAPLLDYWGNSPHDPSAPPEDQPEAWVQYVNGLPWNWLTRTDLIYEPFRPRTNSPYGRAPIESLLLNANTDIRFQLYFLQRFCYDDQTEILTRDGWKRFPDVRGDEEFATRSADGSFEWQHSNDGKLHEFDSGGTMVEFRNRYVDLLVTPNHRMLTRRKRQGRGIFKTARDWEHDWHIRRADDFLGKCCVDWRLPITSSWAPPAEAPERFTRSVAATQGRTGRSVTTKVDMPMWAFARFLGVFVAEGNLRHDAPGKVQRYEINVAQMAGGKLDEVRRILKDTGLAWRYDCTEASGHFSVGCKALWTYLEQCGRGAWNKVLPAEVLDWPADLLEHLIYGLMLGDGTVNKAGTPSYITTSRRLADQVQEIWQKCGMYSRVIVKTPHATSFGHREQYHVCARPGETEFQVPTPAAVPYEGNVYCVSVPNGIVLVRRNGKTMWCGNTAGNVPEAFASAPETWSPDQIEQFQAQWDALLYGDQARKNQIRWIPGGAKIAWSNEKDFTDDFSLFLMRKTCACFHVVPSDLGFTETVNLASSESQVDVQHRVGELPLDDYIENLITAFLQDDLGLPLAFQFDKGEEQEDQLAQAQADQIYIQNGSVSASEIREMRFGLAEPVGQVVPRFIMTSRSGPVPLSSLMGVAGKIDPETASPEPGVQLPHMAFTEVPGVVPNPPLAQAPLAEQEYGPAAIPPAPPMQAIATPKATAPAHQVAKEGESAGVTSGTGVYGYDGPGDDDEDDDEREAAVAKELAAFRRFSRSRQRAGTWRDFRFGRVDAGTARALNAEGRAAVTKAASGYDLSPRAGMISLDLPEGLIEAVPGGVDDFHVTVVFLGQDVDDGLLANVCQRAAAAAAAMPGPLDATVTGVGSFPPSDGSDGKVPAWAAVLLPDCATQLRGGLADLSASEHADWHPHMTLAYLDDGDPLPDPLPPTPVTFTHLSVHRGGQVVQRFPLGGEDVAKAADAGPKAPSWPGWELNKRTVAYWAPLLAAAAAASLTASQAKALAAQWLSENPEPVPAGRKREANAAAADWLTSHGVTFDLADLAAGIAADGYVIGASSASSLTGGSADTDGWQPGDTKDAEAQVAAAGLTVSGADVAGMQAAYLDAAARSLTDSQGTDPATAGQALADAVADPGLAQNVVLNQVVSASAQAAEGVYEGQGIEQVDILNGPNPCPTCAELAATNPHSPGLVPVHDFCQCGEAPHV